MNSQTLSLFPFGALGRLLRAIQAGPRDPRMEAMRWRLHLRLLLISAALSAAFFFINLGRGHWDETGLGAVASLGAWAWLRQHPAQSRLVARVMVCLFLGLGSYALFALTTPAVHWALLAMTIMTVFGTLLDGPISGSLAAGVTALSASIILLRGGAPYSPLSVAFAIPTTLSLFSTALAHTWLFGQLVQRQQRSANAVQQTTQATEVLARTLSEEVTQATQRLQVALQKGLDGLVQAHDLRGVLKDARVRLPEALPRNSVDAQGLLEELRSSVHRFFLGVAMLVALSATGFILWLKQPLWELAALVGTVTAMLLWLGDPLTRWRRRLHLFLLACLASIVADIVLSQAHPPAASVVFLPMIVFYAGMLASPRLAYAVFGAGLLLLAYAFNAMGPLPGHGTMLSVVALTSLTLAAISAATVPLYHRLLHDLQLEEDRLHSGLLIYRRLVSTLFHDLANPLAVLQGLAALPKDLRQTGDLERARRMLERLRAVSDSARFAAVSQGHGLAPVTAGELADGLADLFEERLRNRQLALRRGHGMDLQLRQGGSLLRDSILGNLLSNAIKFSPLGGILHFSAERAEGGVWLRLHDAGPGFPDEALRDLARGVAPKPQPGQDGELGSGFGLLLAQSYAKDLGGRLILSNRAAGGAQADLWLPD